MYCNALGVFLNGNVMDYGCMGELTLLGWGLIGE